MFRSAPTPAASVRPAAGTCVLAMALLLAGAAGADTTGGEGGAAEPRHSRSSRYEGGRDASSPASVTSDRYGPMVTSGERSKPARDSTGLETSAAPVAAKAVSDDFWIYHADVQLFDDDDRDGYYHGIDLLFDADTVYEEADVYAVLYLSFEGGPWNEYAVTDTFRIFGATSDDEYVVITELETGYPRGNYDLVIDLYDTWDGSFVATLGPEDTSALSYLPLEDLNRDDPDRGGRHGGGGAVDLWTILAILAYALAFHLVRRRQRR